MLPTTLVVMEEQSSSLAEQITQKLIPNLGSFLTQLSALVVLIVLVIIFGYKPIKKMLNKRSDYIESNINDANEKNSLANQNLAQSQEKIIASQKQAEEIISQAKIKASEERNNILESTNIEIAQMKETAKKQIEQSELEAKESIRQEMVSLALDASEELLKRNVSDEDNKKLVQDFIEGIDS